jgi:hypothetical protein
MRKTGASPYERRCDKVPRIGFEPITLGSEDRYSIQLSYRGTCGVTSCHLLSLPALSQEGVFSRRISYFLGFCDFSTPILSVFGANAAFVGKA